MPTNFICHPTGMWYYSNDVRYLPSQIVQGVDECEVDAPLYERFLRPIPIIDELRRALQESPLALTPDELLEAEGQSV